MRARDLLATMLMAGLAAAFPAAAGAQHVEPARPIAFHKVTLRNGLIAILNEDHSTPVVAVDVQVHLGSADEPPGHTGYAHLCEHIYDQGSLHEPTSEKAFLAARGALAGHWAQTDENRTRFYYTVPSNQLETALWMEADRLAWPFTQVDSARLPAVRDVVQQEWLQQRVTPPFALTGGIISRALYPADKPLPRDPIGDMDELAAATLGDLHGFCLPYYVPNNVVIGVSGDFRSADVEQMLHRYFDGIPRGKPVTHPVTAPLALTGDVRLALEDSHVRVARLSIAWPAAGFSDPDKQTLNIIANLLAPIPSGAGPSPPGTARTARLSKLLLYDLKLATLVNAAHYDLEHGGVFQIDVIARAGVPLGNIEHIVDSVVAALPTAPVTPLELERYKNFNIVAGVTALQSPEARADTLAQGQLYAGDPLAYRTQMSQGLAVTEADIHRAAKKYLGAGRVVMSVVPVGKLDLVSQPERPYTNATPHK